MIVCSTCRPARIVSKEGNFVAGDILAPHDSKILSPQNSRDEYVENGLLEFAGLKWNDADAWLTPDGQKVEGLFDLVGFYGLARKEWAYPILADKAKLVPFLLAPSAANCMSDALSFAKAELLVVLFGNNVLHGINPTTEDTYCASGCFSGYYGFLGETKHPDECIRTPLEPATLVDAELKDDQRELARLGADISHDREEAKRYRYKLYRGLRYYVGRRRSELYNDNLRSSYVRQLDQTLELLRLAILPTTVAKLLESGYSGCIEPTVWEGSMRDAEFKRVHETPSQVRKRLGPMC